MTLTEDHAPVYAEMLTGWKVAKKVKSIRAKPVVNVMVDRSVLSKFLITTLEAMEPLGDGSVICLGETGDIWQQMPKKLLAKYDVVDVDKDGWMYCMPKADNAVDCLQWTDPIITHSGEHWVKAQWGENFRTYGPCQRFGKGDYICRNRTDHTDVWVVREKFFNNTYTVIV